MTAPEAAHIIIALEPNPAHVKGMRARCKCGWVGNVYARLADAHHAGEVHVRQATRTDFEGLLARSSIGAAVADVKARGIDAHLSDIEHEDRRRWPTRKKP